MKMYLYLQFKRMLRVFPYVLLVTALLASGLAAVFSGIMQLESESADQQRFQIAVVGDTDDPYISLGKTALESFDSTRFSLELVIMEEAEAKAAIQRGDISVYVVIPEGFVEAALYGEVKTIKYVTTAGSIGITSIFKEEITQAIVELLTYSQKGIYGTQGALEANGHKSHSLINKHVNAISIDYAEFLFTRSGLYEVEELGVSDGLSLAQYYFCGIAVLFVFLLGLPYAALFVKKDYSLNRMLFSGGYSPLKQLLCEYVAYFAAMLLLVGVITGGLAVLGSSMEMFDATIAVDIGIKMIPVVAMIAAFNIMVFEISGNIVGGVLLQFFSGVAMCYISGCFYPIYALPQVMQVVSRFLPTGLARGYLANCIIGDNVFINFVGVVVYLFVFFALAVVARAVKIAKKRG